jgi:hypothetical protein
VPGHRTALVFPSNLAGPVRQWIYFSCEQHVTRVRMASRTSFNNVNHPKRFNAGSRKSKPRYSLQMPQEHSSSRQIELANTRPLRSEAKQQKKSVNLDVNASLYKEIADQQGCAASKNKTVIHHNFPTVCLARSRLWRFVRGARFRRADRMSQFADQTHVFREAASSVPC